MMQMRVFEFLGTVALFGIDRDQAAALLEEVERTLTREFPAVSLARFSRSHDRAMLVRRGIDMEGEPAEEAVWGKSPPAQAAIDHLRACWLQEKDPEREAHLAAYAEERKRQNPEILGRRASVRARKEPDRIDRQSEGGTS